MAHSIMPTHTTLSPQFSVSAALSTQDFQGLAAAGFKSILNVRPDGEAANQLTSADAEQAARDAGLAYAHIPVRKHDLFADDVVAETSRTLADLPGPVLAFCASGQRAVILWAAASARSQSASSVLEALRAAGYDFEFLRDDLEAQADRARWSTGESEVATQPHAPAAEKATDRAAA